MPSLVSRHSRSKVYQRRQLFKREKVAAPKKTVEVKLTKTVPVNGEKNGKERVIMLKRASSFYPAEDIAVPKKNRKSTKPATLRASITPGTVLILLAGRFRGKRVVFLKQLASGLLLVTGPHKVNGVPLRRVNQAYVIATSTKVDLTGVSVDAKFNDDYFKRPKDAKTKADFLAENKEKKTLDAARLADQKAVDAPILAAVRKVPTLKQYLGASFSLKRGQFPHLIKF